MAKLLVTGSRGLIGHRLAGQLMLAGHEVRGLDWSYPENHMHFGNLLSVKDVRRAVEGVDGIIHLAAISRVAWGERDPQLCHDVNVNGTVNLLDAANASPQDPWFILASSREVYGEPSALPVREDTPCEPFNTYGRSKLQSELALQSLGGRLASAVLRFANVYGGRRDHSDRVVPAFLQAAISGRTLHVHGANNAFDFTHVNDVVRGIRLAADRLMGARETLPPVHFVTGIPTTLGRLAELAVAVTQSDSPIDIETGRPGFVSRFVGDPGLAEQLLGFRCEIPLIRGLAELACAFDEPADSRYAQYPEWAAVEAVGP